MRELRWHLIGITAALILGAAILGPYAIWLVLR